MPRREILNKSLGKHIGHALEGHCRGLIGRIAQARACKVVRELPFSFPVHPDLVVLDENNHVRALGMVAYSSQGQRKSPDNSSLKFYRTRFEHIAAVSAYFDSPSLFSSTFNLLTVIYGTTGGWKPSLVEELKEKHPVTLFLPELIPEKYLDHIISDVFQMYRSLWEGGDNYASQKVEDYFNNQPNLPRHHIYMMRLLEEAIFHHDIDKW